MKRFLGIALAIGILSSCSGGQRKADQVKTEPVKSAPTQKLTKEDVLQKYSLQELNAAANALKVASDKDQDLLGCSISAKSALSMTMPLKALIDEQTRAEIAAYEQDPKAYGGNQSFEKCAGECSCGVLSDVVSGAQESAMPRNSSVLHKRNLTRLKAKAERQSSEDSFACARKQSWFCSSELRSYLDRELAENQ